MKIKIVTDKDGHMRVLTEHGEELEYVTFVTVEASALAPKPTAVIHVMCPILDIAANAEVKRAE